MISYNSTYSCIKLPVLLLVSQPSYQLEMYKTATFGLLIRQDLNRQLDQISWFKNLSFDGLVIIRDVIAT